MDHKNRYLAIRPAIRRVLMEKWDPLGVSGDPEAAHEYDNYIPEVYSLLAGGAPDQQITDHLRRIVVDRMSLETPDPTRLLEAAHALREAFQGAD